MNQKLKIVEGARVCMNASDDTYIVEGAWGTVVETGITLSIVRWTACWHLGQTIDTEMN